MYIALRRHINRIFTWKCIQFKDLTLHVLYYFHMLSHQGEGYLQSITCFGESVGMEAQEEKVFHFLASGCTPHATIFALFILLMIRSIKCFFTFFNSERKKTFNLSASLNVLQASQHLNKHPMWGALDIRVFFHRCLITSPKVSDYSLLESQMMLFPISGNSP